MNEIILKVNGMMCGGCENRIKNALEDVKGVKDISANHSTGVVKVSGSEILKEEVVNIIEDLGFEIVEEN